MMFTILRRWSVHIENIHRPGYDAVAGALVLYKDEYQSESFQRILSAKVFDMKDRILRHAAVKWNKPSGSY